MDLRVKRTINSIKEAFFELRKKKSLNKISVKELSELAMINKATFYLHYRDIFELSDKLENEMINKIIDEVRGQPFSYTETDLRRFSEIISRAVIKNSDEINILFSGFENNAFINRLEDSLKIYIFTAFPKIRNTTENNLLLTFLIQGAFHTFLRNDSVRADILEDQTIDMTVTLADAYIF